MSFFVNKPRIQLCYIDNVNRRKIIMIFIYFLFDDVSYLVAKTIIQTGYPDYLVILIMILV